jgi:type VI secretion system protein ImpH
MPPLPKPSSQQNDWPEENFFALLRRIEQTQPDMPLLGTSLRLREDPVRLGQHPHLDFATRDFKRSGLVRSVYGKELQKLYVQNFGLLGPHGALPLHYTEHACNRLQQWGDPTFAEFLDVFHHRIYLLFYRAWAVAQPQVAYHRKEGNSFGRQLNALVAYDSKSMREREVLPAGFRASLAGHFSRRTKTMEGLGSIMAVLTGQPVRVDPFQARWLKVEQPEIQSRLGLGSMLGSRTWCAQSGILIHIGPMPYKAYEKLLPGQPLYQRLKQAVLAYLGLEFDCGFRLEIHGHEIPQASLGSRARLGQTAWLGSGCASRAEYRKPGAVHLKGISK